jgi:hypothetical protein
MKKMRSFAPVAGSWPIMAKDTTAFADPAQTGWKTLESAGVNSQTEIVKEP